MIGTYVGTSTYFLRISACHACAMSHVMSDTSGHSGHPKYSSGWVGPPKIWPGSGRATQKPWPAGQNSGRVLAQPSPIVYAFLTAQ